MALTESEELELLELEEQESGGTAAPGSAQPGAYQPSMLERASDVSQSAHNAIIGPAMRGVGKAVDLLPYPLRKSAELGGYLASKAAQGIENVGGYASEKLGQAGVNPYVAGAVGTGIANAPYFMLPGGRAVAGGKRVMAAIPPVERAASVAAARKMGVPLTRAQITGSRLTAGIENQLEKSPMGSGPMQEFYGQQQAAMASAKGGLQEKLGTQADLYSVGQQAQEGQNIRTSAMNQQRREMFEKVPQDVIIPLDQSTKMADTIIQEQSKFLTGTRDAEVVSLAKDIQNAATAVANGSPNWSTIQRLREVLGKKIEQNNPGTLSGLSGQSNQVGRDYQRLKAALDADINSGPTLPVVDPTQIKGGPPRAIYQGNWDATQDNPAYSEFILRGEHPRSGGNFNIGELDKMGVPVTGREARAAGQVPIGLKNDFAEKYRQANAFSGAYKGLFKSNEARSLAALPPERVVDSVFKRNNETAIKKFRAIVGEDAFQTAKQKFTNDLLESGNVDAELAKYKPGTLDAIYTRPEIEQIRNFGSTQGLTKTVSGLQGTQGSARSNISTAQNTGLIGGIGSAGTLMATGHPIAAAGVAATAVGQYMLPKHLANAYLKTTRGFMTPRIPVGAASRAALAQFIDKVTTK